MIQSVRSRLILPQARSYSARSRLKKSYDDLSRAASRASSLILYYIESKLLREVGISCSRSAVAIRYAGIFSRELYLERHISRAFLEDDISLSRESWLEKRLSFIERELHQELYLESYRQNYISSTTSQELRLESLLHSKDDEHKLSRDGEWSIGSTPLLYAIRYAGTQVGWLVG
jgi:hypothetical protein